MHTWFETRILLNIALAGFIGKVLGREYVYIALAGVLLCVVIMLVYKDEKK